MIKGVEIAGDRRQETEGRGQRTEDRRQRTEDRGQRDFRLSVEREIRLQNIRNQDIRIIVN